MLQLLIKLIAFIIASTASVVVMVAFLFVALTVAFTIMKATGTSITDALEISGRAIWQFCVYANNIAQWLVNLWN